MLNWLFGGKQKTSEEITLKAPTYEQSREIAASGDVDARRKLAECEDLQPEYLYYFATDEAPEVRRTVARNNATPLQADLILARDKNDDVRCHLAEKVGRLVPDMSRDQNEKVADMVFEVLDILAHDDATSVRAIVAKEICSLHNVPKSIVTLLAGDEEEVVCAPVLEHSPLLEDDDLIALIANGLKSGALTALSRRVGVSEKVSAAVQTQISEAGLSQDDGKTEEVINEINRLFAENALDSKVILAALEAGNILFVVHAMAKRSDLDAEAVRKLFTLRSARTVVAVTWKSGLDMEVAMALQRRGANIPFDKIIHPAPDGDFPLSQQDLEWQLDLL